MRFTNQAYRAQYMSEEVEKPAELQKSAKQSALIETKDELLARLQAELKVDEVVLWAEQAVPDRKRTMQIKVAAIAITSLALLATSNLFIGNKHPSTATIVVDVVFAFWMFRIFRQFFEGQNRSLRNRVAVLTNMRALEIDSHQCITMVWYSSPTFDHVEAVQKKTGLGNLLFTRDKEENQLGFMDVPNVAEAAEILKRVQAKKIENRENKTETG